MTDNSIEQQRYFWKRTIHGIVDIAGYSVFAAALSYASTGSWTAAPDIFVAIWLSIVAPIVAVFTDAFQFPAWVWVGIVLSWIEIVVERGEIVEGWF